MVEIGPEHLALADKAVNAAMRRLPPWVDRDDLRSAALEALARAARSYDPARASFGTYAWRRMSGAILDHLRDASPYTRQQLEAIRRGERPAHAGGRSRQPVEFDGYEFVQADDETLARPFGDPADVAAALTDAYASLRRLPRRDQVILLRRAAGWTQEALADEMGVTAAYVCILEKAARGRLLAA